MKKIFPVITSQRAIEISKISDLVEVVGSRGSLSRWCIDGVEYVYVRGDRRVTACDVRGFDTRSIFFDQPTKTAAKKAIFQDIVS